MTKICSHQPSLLPWVGFWNKVLQCEEFIALCGVPYSHHDFQNRVKVLGSWLTIPVQHDTKFCPIQQVKVADTEALKRGAIRIRQGLMSKKYKYGSRLEPLVEVMATRTYSYLCGVNLALMQVIGQILQLQQVVCTDFVPPDAGKSKTENLVAHVRRHAEQPVYYAGQGTLQYLDHGQVDFPVMVQQLKPEVFSESIVQVIAQEPDVVDYIHAAATWRSL